MSDDIPSRSPSPAPPPPPMEGWFSPGRNNAQLVYILYLAGFLMPLTPIVGLVFAYINRGKGEAWVNTHYTWQIRTFWIGVLGWVVTFALFFVVIGFLTALALTVWYVVRCVIGLQAVDRGEPIGNPQSWIV